MYIYIYTHVYTYVLRGGEALHLGLALRGALREGAHDPVAVRLDLGLFIYIYIYTYIHTYIYIYIYIYTRILEGHPKDHPSSATQVVPPKGAQGRGRGGHREARPVQGRVPEDRVQEQESEGGMIRLETLVELKFLNSSCSSSSYCRNQTNGSLSSNSRQRYLSQQYPPFVCFLCFVKSQTLDGLL